MGSKRRRAGTNTRTVQFRGGPLHGEYRAVEAGQMEYVCYEQSPPHTFSGENNFAGIAKIAHRYSVPVGSDGIPDWMHMDYDYSSPTHPTGGSDE